MRAMEIITYVFAVLATLMLVIGLGSASGAPQEGAIAALASAMIIIPYAVTSTMQRRVLLNRLASNDVNQSERRK